jgi:serine/threonine protein kinase
MISNLVNQECQFTSHYSNERLAGSNERSLERTKEGGRVVEHENTADDRIVEFLRKRDYRLVKVLGQGACGRTVLLHDDVLNEYFVCKKYRPYSEAERQALYSNFVNEIRLLLKANHRNVVRVFHYYLYPDQFSGFIVMEYVEGVDIGEYLRSNPERCSG